MKKLCFAIMAMISSITLHAETSDDMGFEVEVDPIAYALRGYSVHGIITHNKWRVDAGIFGAAQPEAYNGNKGFEVYSEGIGVKLNRLLNKKGTWFAGIGSGYAVNNVKHMESNRESAEHVVSIGVHTGYRFFLLKNTALKNLYITPWVSFDYNMPVKDAAFTGNSYHTNSFSVFPTVHIGYRF